jgi:hypothetical protein
MIPVLSLTQVRISKFVVLFGDVVAFSVAFVIATFINVSIDANQNISVWFSTQDKERYVAWFGLAFLGIMFFPHALSALQRPQTFLGRAGRCVALGQQLGFARHDAGGHHALELF